MTWKFDLKYVQFACNSGLRNTAWRSSVTVFSVESSAAFSFLSALSLSSFLSLVHYPFFRCDPVIFLQKYSSLTQIVLTMKIVFYTLSLLHSRNTLINMWCRSACVHYCKKRSTNRSSSPAWRKEGKLMNIPHAIVWQSYTIFWKNKTCWVCLGFGEPVLLYFVQNY